MHVSRSLLLLSTGFLVVAGCATAPGPAPVTSAPARQESVTLSQADQGEVLVQAGTEVITVEEFEAELARRGDGFPGRYATLEEREELLEEMIQYESLVAMARKQGFDKDPEIVNTLRRIIATKYLRQELDGRLETVEISDEDVEAYYQEHNQEFLTPERSKAAMIVVNLPSRATDEYRAKQEARMNEAVEEARKLDPGVKGFGVVAKNYSDDQATRYIGGEVGWLYKQRADSYIWGPDVVDAIFALQEPGELSPLVRTDEALYLLRLVEKEERSVVPLEKIQASLKARIIKDRRAEIREAFYGEIQTELGVAVDREKLKAIPPPPSALEPPETQEPPPVPEG